MAHRLIDQPADLLCSGPRHFESKNRRVKFVDTKVNQERLTDAIEVCKGGCRRDIGECCAVEKSDTYGSAFDPVDGNRARPSRRRKGTVVLNCVECGDHVRIGAETA